MIIDKVSIGDVKMNPNNPRSIDESNFNKLVDSIKEFPEMLEIRPIVVNKDMVVLGGNMRLKACKEAGLKKIPIIRAENLTDDQQREFIIKDNVGFGEWDWEMIASDWNAEELNEWGLEVPEFESDQIVESIENNEEYQNEMLWFLNVQMESEKECSALFDELKERNYEVKIVN